MLRRTAKLNSAYLPPKYEIVLFVKPNSLQLEAYRQVICSKVTASYISNCDVHQGQILALITVLRKIAISPRLLMNDEATLQSLDLNIATDDSHKDLVDGCKSFVCLCDSENLLIFLSAKTDVVRSLLSHFKSIGEKVVLVSNWTQTLDLMQDLCKSEGYTYGRLDGSTPAQNRQK